ncbi:MAG: RdgB/HAM1 family non-canonical purine NTP pyrophosphatase [Promethearchaeota archaeon]|jgi:XTP/dITP diphosphohydrolase
MNKEEKKIYFVTGNNNKFNEALEVFTKEGVAYELKQKNIETIEIQAKTLKDVALFKLNSVKHEIDGSFFIEDAGFFVDSPLGGFPGVYSSYVLKTIGNKGILKLIDDYEKSKAHFSAIISLYFKPTDSIILFDGYIPGRISGELRGEGGFGFDPIFIPDSIPDKTFAELSIYQKNHISHRGQALEKLIVFLKKNRNRENQD